MGWLLRLVVLAAIAAGLWYGWTAWTARKAAAEGPAAGASAAGGPPGGGRGGRAGGPGGFNAGPIAVVAEPATAGAMPVRLGALGTVTARNTVVVRPQVAGRLDKIAFEEGQMVKAGQLLAQIDPRSFQAQLDSALAQQQRDAAQLAGAEVDLTRYRTLLAQDSIASQQVDTQAALVEQYKGTVAADRAAVASARLQLSYARVTAPISGRVGLKQVDVGNYVQTSDSNGLVVITEVTPIAVTFPIPQQQLPAVMARLKDAGASGTDGQRGAQLAVEAWDGDNRKQLATGKLLTADNQIDVSTGTVKLKAEFPNTDGALFPNQFVNVRLTVSTIENAVLVPSSAVQQGASGPYVFVVNDGDSVSLRQLRTGPTDGTRIAVLQGLQAGERVVVDGLDRLREGAKVQVMAKHDVPVAASGAGRRGHRPGMGASGAGARGASAPGDGASWPHRERPASAAQ